MSGHKAIRALKEANASQHRLIKKLLKLNTHLVELLEMIEIAELEADTDEINEDGEFCLIVPSTLIEQFRELRIALSKLEEVSG